MDKDKIDAIKLNNSVADVLSQYGVRVVGGRCKAICHLGKRLTAKVSHDLYYCFKCDKSMDVFDITMHLTDCNFSEAYELLGGKEEVSFSTRVKVRQKQAKRDLELKRLRKRELDHKENIMKITAYRAVIEEENPFSDAWCYAQNNLQYELYRLDDYIERG